LVFYTYGTAKACEFCNANTAYNDCIQKRAQDSHSGFNQEERFEPESGAVAEKADEDAMKYREQPDVA
jgi:hypothetical protein